MIRVEHGDCLAVLPTLAADSIHACVTDPPYHLTSIVKRFGKNGSAPVRSNPVYQRSSAGFMGKQWDGGDVAFRMETWDEVYRVLKPGAHLIAFGGTRTYHRMASAIEGVGFEIRDQIGWAFGSGFPKSHNAGNGWGTALKPAWEPIVLARKPLIGTVAANVQAHGTGALDIDGCRVSTDGEVIHTPQSDPSKRAGIVGTDLGITRTDADRCRPSQSESVERANRLGRWPANIIHDGSEEVIAAFPGSDGGSASGYDWRDSNNDNPTHIAHNIKSGMHFGDSGSAARFFYTAKADAGDRLQSKHPTVKPVDLMAYLCRLITPPGGTVLDPFAGSGTTGMACMREGFDCILIEREREYYDDILRRLAHVQGADTPLFSSAPSSAPPPPMVLPLCGSAGTATGDSRDG